MSTSRVPLLAALAAIAAFACQESAAQTSAFSCVIPPGDEAKPLPPGIDPTNSLARLGYLDVTLYGADPTGVEDSTAAIQDAINDAYAHEMATFFPSGTYRVSDTLHMLRCQDGETAFRERLGHQLVGSTAGSRPTIRLADSAPGFDDPSQARSIPGSGIYTTTKAVIHAWSPSCVTASGGSGPCNRNNTTPILDPELQRSAQNFNQVVRGLDIDLGQGNPGATGIRMASSEGSAIQDVRITATGAFAGLYSLPGSGGSATNVEITGGRYGVFGAQTGIMPVIAGLRLAGQAERAIWYNGLTPMTVVGFDLSKSVGPAIELRRDGSQSSRGHLTLVDGRIELSDGDAPVVANTDRNVYVDNVFVRGASTIVENGFDGSRLQPADPAQWTRIDEYAFSRNDYSDETKIIDGVKTSTTQVSLAGPVESPPSDLVTRHVWPEAYWGFEDADTKVVDDFGAVGDGVNDDTAAIQAAIDAANRDRSYKVLIPRGHYRVSDTLELGRHTRLFGVATEKSRLEPIGWQAATNTPVIESSGSRSSRNGLADLKIELYGSTYKVYAIKWTAGRKSIVKGVWPLWDFDSTRSSHELQRTLITGNGGGRWYNLQNGNGVDTSEAGNRGVLVDGTSEPLQFYMFHNQHVAGDAISEIRNSRNVSIYGVKSETHGIRPNETEQDWPVPLKVSNSCNVTIHGYSGLGEQQPGEALIEITDSTGVVASNIARWGPSVYEPADWFHVTTVVDGVTSGIRATTPVNMVRIGQRSGLGKRCPN